MYIISGQDRKSGVARATEATASLAPLNMYIIWNMLIADNKVVQASYTKAQKTNHLLIS